MLEETRKLFEDLKTSDPNDARKQDNLLQTEQKLLAMLEGIKSQGYVPSLFFNEQNVVALFATGMNTKDKR